MYVKPDERLNALVEEVRQKMVQKDGWVISEVQRHIIGYFFPKKQEMNNLKGVLLWVLDETIMACQMYILLFPVFCRLHIFDVCHIDSFLFPK